MINQTQLAVTTEPHEKGIVLCPAGRIDGSNAGVLEEAIREQLESGHSVLVFDFSELNYISSAGLRILLVAARDTQSQGGKSIFCGLSEQIAEVFSVSGFDKILAIHASRDEALGTI